MGLDKLAKKLAGGGLKLLGGLVGGGAGVSVAKTVAGVLGLDEGASENDILDQIEKDPQAFVELKKYEMSNKVELQKIGLELVRLEIGDTQSARQREIAIVEATGQKDTNLYVLAWVIVGGFFVLLGMLIFVNLPPGSNAVLFTMFGGLVTSFAMVVGYFFGSSKSSSDKTKMMNVNLAK